MSVQMSRVESSSSSLYDATRVPVRPSFPSQRPIDWIISRHSPFITPEKVANLGYDLEASLIEHPAADQSKSIVVQDLVVPYLTSASSSLYRAGLLESDRILEDGGWIVITTPGYDNLQKYHRVVELMSQATGFLPPQVGGHTDLKNDIRSAVRNVLPTHEAQTFSYTPKMHFPDVEAQASLLGTLLPHFKKDEEKELSDQEYAVLVKQAKSTLLKEQDLLMEDEAHIDITVVIKPSVAN